MGKKIVVLSLQDHTGSGYKMAEAISLNTTHFVEYMVLIDDLSGHVAHKFPYMYYKKIDPNDAAKNGWETSKSVLAFAQKMVDTADIIHLKGDELPKGNNFYGIILPEEVPKVITVSGSFFRRRKEGEISPVAMANFPVKDYVDISQYRSAITPDLNYPDLKGEFIPHAYNCKDIENVCKYKEVPHIVHYSAGNDKKGTATLLKALRIIKDQGYKYTLDIIKSTTNAECLRRISEATWYFDQISDVGWWGFSGVEAMAMGVPVIAYVKKSSIEQAGNFPADPVCHCGKTPEELAENFKALFTLAPAFHKEVSEESHKWVKENYSYEVIGKKWGRIYDSL